MTQPSSDVAASGDSQTLDAPWPHVPLPDVVAHIVDNRGRTAPVASSGIPLIATDCIKEDTLYPVRQNLRYVSQETYETWFRGHPEPGDVILVNKGTPGRVCQVPSPVDFCIAQDMVALRPKPGVVDSDYLLAALRSSDFKEQVEGLHVGTMIPHLKKTDFHHLKVPLPPLPIQRGIGRIYCDLSRKLELNRRMNRTLEELAAALFRSWFVDFDPVVAKAAGRPPAHLRPALAALFPAHFQDSPLGPIPHGWRTESIYTAADVIYGATFASGKFNTASMGKPLIRIRNLPDDNSDTFTTEVHPKGYLVRPGDIVVGMDGEFRAYLWGGEESWLNQRLCVFQPKPDFSAPFVRCAITAPLAEVEATELATTVIHLGKQDIDRFQFVCPPPEVLARFKEISQPWYDQIVHNRRETRTLAALRDTLLPKLLSGELRVKQAEKLVEATA